MGVCGECKGNIGGFFQPTERICDYNECEVSDCTSCEKRLKDCEHCSHPHCAEHFKPEAHECEEAEPDETPEGLSIDFKGKKYLVLQSSGDLRVDFREIERLEREEGYVLFKINETSDAYMGRYVLRKEQRVLIEEKAAGEE